MTKKLSEIEALQGIDNLLAPLTDDERQRIYSYVVSKYDLKAPSPTGGGNTAKNSPGNSANPSHHDSNITVKDFLAAKKPNDTYERIACLAYHIEKIQEIEGFKTAEITKANKDSRLSPMSNPATFVNRATRRYGYLTPIGASKKALSARGEALVNALPDREKAAIALAEHPLKKKARKKAAKKKKGKS